MQIYNKTIFKFLEEQMNLTANGFYYEIDDKGFAKVGFMNENNPFLANNTLVQFKTFDKNGNLYSGKYIYAKLNINLLNFKINGFYVDDELDTQTIYSKDGKIIPCNYEGADKKVIEFVSPWQLFCKNEFGSAYESEVLKFLNSKILFLQRKQKQNNDIISQMSSSNKNKIYNLNNNQEIQTYIELNEHYSELIEKNKKKIESFQLLFAKDKDSAKEDKQDNVLNM